jgi:hypothetical protein
VCRPAEQADARAPAKPQQWEYKVLAEKQIEGFAPGESDPEAAKAVTSEFNKLGQQGREYVGHYGYDLVFKRPKR